MEKIKQKNGKNGPKMDKNWDLGPFSYFSAIFAYFWGEAKTKIFPIFSWKYVRMIYR